MLEKKINAQETLHAEGIQLARQQRFGEAVDYFNSFLAQYPNQTEVFRHLAQAYADSGRLSEAEDAWKRYIDAYPGSADGYRALGNLQKRRANLPEAIRSLERAIEIDGQVSVSHVDLGLALTQAKRHDDAKKAFLRALEIDADCYDAHLNLGMLLQEMKQSEKALEYLQKAVTLRPKDPSGHNNLGVVLSEQGKLAEAIECYYKLLETTPNYALAWNNLGNALRSARRNDEALTALQKALELKPDYTEAHNNLGIIYTQLEKFPEAVAAFDRALFLRPDYPEAHANRGLVYLLLGDFQRGWADYEWRWHGKNGLKRRKYSGKPWDGSPLSGKRILLYFEQGLGDTFQFIRYAKELKARGATVIFECQRNTKAILSRTLGIDELVVRGDKPPICDFYAPVLGLPGLCQTDLNNLPRRVPYVFTDPVIAWEWKQRISKIPGFKIGIVWQGNPEHKGDKNRSIPLKTFEALARVPGVTLITLQKNFGVEQIENLDGLFPVVDLKGMAENCDGFLRTAAIIANLDLVISADTSVAHLAGAMGVPVWIAVQMSPDWRWLLEREDTPWYPTMRLFRQREAGNWNEVFERMAVALNEGVAGAAELKSESSAITELMDSERLLREASEHLKRNENDAAQALLQQAVRLDPTNAGIHQDLGVTFAKSSRYLEAIVCFRRGIELAPDSADLYGNLGLACYHVGQIEEAVTNLRKTLWLGASSANVYKNLGRALADLPDPLAAEDAYWSALRLRPDDAEAHYLLSLALLAQGKFEQGWLEYEWRRKWMKSAKPHRSTRPRWVGQNLSGKRILLHAEEDSRDTIQFVRYADLLCQQDAQVYLECQSDFTELLAGCVGIHKVYGLGDALPEHDFQASLPSLPTIFATSVCSIPAARPYLGVRHDLVDLWRERLKSEAKCKVGIIFHKDDFGQRAERATKRMLSELRDQDAINVESFNLGIPAINPAGESLETKIRKLPRESGQYYSAIGAIVRNMDIVLADDHEIAHMAGSMGVATQILLPKVCHHRWLEGRRDSPWYPSIRVLRQQRDEDKEITIRRFLDDVKHHIQHILRQ